MKKKVILTWGHSITRSKSLAKNLDYYDFHIQPVFKKQYLKIFNYLISAIKMFVFLMRNTPTHVVVVLPPVFLLYVVMFYKLVTFSKFKIVCDLHNGVVRKEWANWFLIKRLLKSSDCVLSHNVEVKKHIDEHFAINSLVLPDPLSVYERSNISKSKFLIDNKINILVPVSYADDEPITDILEAAESLSADFNFILTGNYRKKFKDNDIENLPITFTGFISDQEYNEILLSCDVVLCLTLNDDIQMCALIESISADKPFICSDNTVNRTMFSDFYFCCTQNTSDSIAKSFKLFKDASNINTSQEAKRTYNINWEKTANEIF